MWYDSSRFNALGASYSRHTLSRQDYSVRRGSYERLISNYYGKNAIFKRTLPYAGNYHLLETNEATKDVELSLTNLLYDAGADSEGNVEDLVESYNKLLKTFETTEDGAFTSRRNWLTSLTDSYSEELQKAGLTIGEDGTLVRKTKEEQTVESKEALQALFKRDDSYGKHLLDRTINIGYEALSSLSRSPKLYSANGSHIYSIGTGNLYNAIF